MIYQPLTEEKITNPSLNLAAMVSGIVGLLMCIIPFFGLCAPSLAIMFALIGRGNQIKTEGKGKIGLITGILGLIGNIIGTIVIFVMFANYVISNPAMFY